MVEENEEEKREMVLEREREREREENSDEQGRKRTLLNCDVSSHALVLSRQNTLEKKEQGVQ